MHLSQTFPFFGIDPAVVNDKGEVLEGPCEGYLVSAESALAPLLISRHFSIVLF